MQIEIFAQTGPESNSISADIADITIRSYLQVFAKHEETILCHQANTGMNNNTTIKPKRTDGEIIFG